MEFEVDGILYDVNKDGKSVTSTTMQRSFSFSPQAYRMNRSSRYLGSGQSASSTTSSSLSI